MSHRITAPIAASALLFAALTLTACSGSSTPAATVAAPASTPSSDSIDTPAPSETPSATEAASTGSGCPADLVSGLKSSAAGDFSEVTSADLHFPGSLSGIDSGCFISAKISSAKEVLAFVPGGKTLESQAVSALKKAGYKETSSTSNTFAKSTDVWIVSGADDSTSPLASLSSYFGSGTVLIVHASV